MENIPPLTGEDVEGPTGLLSTELKVRKVRGVKTGSGTVKERRELESQIGDGGRTCAGVAGRMRNSEDKGAVDHAKGKKIIDNTAYPEPDYRRPHSRRCSCNRISWMALNTTGERNGIR